MQVLLSPAEAGSFGWFQRGLSSWFLVSIFHHHSKQNDSTQSMPHAFECRLCLVFQCSIPQHCYLQNRVGEIRTARQTNFYFTINNTLVNCRIRLPWDFIDGCGSDVWPDAASISSVFSSHSSGRPLRRCFSLAQPSLSLSIFRLFLQSHRLKLEHWQPAPRKLVVGKLQVIDRSFVTLSEWARWIMPDAGVIKTQTSHINCSIRETFGR